MNKCPKIMWIVTTKLNTSWQWSLHTKRPTKKIWNKNWKQSYDNYHKNICSSYKHSTSQRPKVKVLIWSTNRAMIIKHKNWFRIEAMQCKDGGDWGPRQRVMRSQLSFSRHLYNMQLYCERKYDGMWPINN